MTINTAQGQTRVGMCLRTPLFVHGQIFVCSSPVRAKRNIKLLIDDSARQGRVQKRGGVARANAVWFTQNPVYIEVLRKVALQEQ